MKILLISDTEDSYLYDYYSPAALKGIDLILSAGDLSPKYLEFLVTMVNVPLLYVRGNHDSIYDSQPPEGCICVENEIYQCKGLRILGLGGSMRYHPGKNMYTEAQMRRRIFMLSAPLKITGGFDILLTHAPARGYGDMEDLPHKGFECFNTLMDTWHPSLMVFGHVHQEYGDFVREHRHPSGTRLINAHKRTIIEIPDPEKKSRTMAQSFYYSYMQRRRFKTKDDDSDPLIYK